MAFKSSSGAQAALESVAKKFKVKCICGTQMTIRHTMSAYNSSVAWCDGCSKSMTKDEYSYHCPKRGSSKHSSGFDYCFDCAHKRYETQKDDKLSDELSLIYHEKYNNINATNINQLFKELALFQEKEYKLTQALNKMIKGANNEQEEEKQNDNNNNNNLQKLELPQTTLHQNVFSLQKLINTQKSMNPLLSNLLNKHLLLMSNWKDWTVTDVIHWFINVDNGAYKQYEIQLTKGITKENVKGSSLKYVDDNCLLRWQVFDIEKRQKLLTAIKSLIVDRTENGLNGMIITTTDGQQEGK